MPCYSPARIRGRDREYVRVPCRQCIGCRLEYSRQWAVRGMHEAACHDENCFLTLTYSDEYLPPWGSLDSAAVPLFMKRLRKSISPRKVSVMYAGEYGSRFGRPHYHVVLFGHDFSDKLPWATRNGLPVWRSGALEKLWPAGQSELGSVTFESVAYVARYITKKVTGAGASAHYQVCDEDGVVHDREPEFMRMSRRPAIGRRWFEEFGAECYANGAGGVLARGRLMKPPRYYDGLMASWAPLELEAVRVARLEKFPPYQERTPERLEAMEKVARGRVNLLPRRLDQ